MTNDTAALRWQMNDREAMACSSIHDDGSPFVYHFEKVGDVWRNKCDAELMHLPTLPEFRYIGTARMWAERNEKALGDALEKEYALLNRPADGGK